MLRAADRRPFLEDDHEKAGVIERGERLNGEIDMTNAAICLNLNILLNDPFAASNGFVESRADRNPQTFPRHIHHIRFRAARWLFEVAADVAGEVHGVSVFLDRHAGRPKSLEDDTLEPLREILILCFRLSSAGQRGAANLAEGKPNREARQALFTQENAVSLIDRLEQSDLPPVTGPLRNQ